MSKEIKSEWVSVKTGDGPMQVYVASPKTSNEKSKHPALIVFQEVFGVNHHIQDVCNRFAEQGYVAAAPELFHRAGEHVEFDYADWSKAIPVLSPLTNNQLLDDTRATYDYLHGRKGVDNSRIAAVGYCLGGFAAMLSGCHLSLKATVSYYGGGIVNLRPNIGLKPILDELKNLLCPALLIYGDKDQGIPKENRDAIMGMLRATNKDFEMVVYPEADHGFFCDVRASYHAPSAKEAWLKTLGWLEEKLNR